MIFGLLAAILRLSLLCAVNQTVDEDSSQHCVGKPQLLLELVSVRECFMCQVVCCICFTFLMYYIFIICFRLPINIPVCMHGKWNLNMFVNGNK